MGLFLTNFLKINAKSQVNKTHVSPNSDSAFFSIPHSLFEVIGATALVCLLVHQQGANQGSEADLLRAMESRCYLKDCASLGFLTLHRNVWHWL